MDQLLNSFKYNTTLSVWFNGLPTQRRKGERYFWLTSGVNIFKAISGVKTA
jgi:hypothetical protein